MGRDGNAAQIKPEQQRGGKEREREIKYHIFPKWKIDRELAVCIYPNERESQNHFVQDAPFKMCFSRRESTLLKMYRICCQHHLGCFSQHFFCLFFPPGGFFLFIHFFFFLLHLLLLFFLDIEVKVAGHKARQRSA